MGAHARPWTADEEAYLRRYWLDKPLSEFAERFGCHRDLVRRHGRKLGLPERPHLVRDAWATSDREAAIAMAKDGHSTLAQIAQRVGRSPKAVQTFIARLGIKVDFAARVWGSAKCRQAAKPKASPKPRNPLPSGRRTNRPAQIGFTPERDTSLAGQACDHLKRIYTPAYHRVIHGKEHAGTYQVGTRILSAGDMIDLAERHGFGERWAA